MTALKALPIAHVSCTQLEGLTDSCKDALIGKGLSEIGLSFFFHFFSPRASHWTCMGIFTFPY